MQRWKFFIYMYCKPRKNNVQDNVDSQLPCFLSEHITHSKCFVYIFHIIITFCCLIQSVILGLQLSVLKFVIISLVQNKNLLIGLTSVLCFKSVIYRLINILQQIPDKQNNILLNTYIYPLLSAFILFDKVSGK